MQEKWYRAHGLSQTKMVKKRHGLLLEVIWNKSLTSTKEGLRLLLCIIGTHEWTIQSLDIKAAFLQGNQLERVVYLKPPKETLESCLVTASGKISR